MYIDLYLLYHLEYVFLYSTSLKSGENKQEISTSVKIERRSKVHEKNMLIERTLKTLT